MNYINLYIYIYIYMNKPINPIYTYTNIDVINMHHMDIYTYVFMQGMFFTSVFVYVYIGL